MDNVISVELSNHISSIFNLPLQDSSCPVNLETSPPQSLCTNKSDASSNSGTKTYSVSKQFSWSSFFFLSSFPCCLSTSILYRTIRKLSCFALGCEDTHRDGKIPLGTCDGQSQNSSSPHFSDESGQSISDMTTAALASDEATGLDDIIRISFFQEFECAEPNLILDVTESCILFSSIDDQMNAPAFQDRGSGRELLTNSDNSWFHLVTHQAKPSNQALLSPGPLDPDETDSFDAHLFIRNFLDLSNLETSSLPALLPKETCQQKRVTLVLDLDGEN